MIGGILPVVRVRAFAEWTTDKHTTGTTVCIGPKVVPHEEIITVAEYKKLIKKGSDARVTVGSDFGHSVDYGNVKAGAFVSITLSCEQDGDVIDEALELAKLKSQLSAYEHFTAMWEIAKAGVEEMGGDVSNL